MSLIDAEDFSPERVIEMVGPTVRYFKHADSKILLCATPATIASGIYQNAFAMVGKDIRTLAIPELAGAIEFGESEEAIARIVEEALNSLPRDGYSAVILACTHYPLAMNAFRKAFIGGILIFDPAEAVAERVEETWWPREAGNGKLSFFISKDSEPFRARVAEFFPESTGKIEVIE